MLCRKDKKFLKNILRKMRKAGMLEKRSATVDGREREVEVGVIPIREEDLIGKVSAYDIVDMETGRILVECNEELTEEGLAKVLGARHRGVRGPVHRRPAGRLVPPRHAARRQDREHRGSGRRDLPSPAQRVIRPRTTPALQHFENLFFNAERYDLSRVGRHKLNHKLGLDVPLEQTTLTREDILQVVKYLIDLKNNKGRSTTSTTSATAGCVRSASCSRTSTASVSIAWARRSRSA